MYATMYAPEDAEGHYAFPDGCTDARVINLPSLERIVAPTSVTVWLDGKPINADHPLRKSGHAQEDAMKLEVTWRDGRHADIENVELYDRDPATSFDEAYVRIHGFFGPYAPELFAAAPKLRDALEEACHHYEFTHGEEAPGRYALAMTEAKK